MEAATGVEYSLDGCSPTTTYRVYYAGPIPRKVGLRQRYLVTRPNNYVSGSRDPNRPSERNRLQSTPDNFRLDF